MIKRILFWLALLFLLAGGIYFLSKGTLGRIVNSIKNVSPQSIVNNAVQSGSSLEQTVQSGVQALETMLSGNTQSGVTTLVVNDAIKDVIADELGLDNFQGNITIQTDTGKNNNITMTVSSTTNSNTNTTISTASDNYTSNNGLSAYDIQQLRRISQNIR